MRSSNSSPSRSERSGPARLLVAVMALAVLVAAFLILRPGSSEPEPTADVVQQPTAATGTTRARASTTSTTSSAPRPPSRPALDAPLLRAGRVRTVDVKAGDTVRLAARSQTDDEIHVHGYDISREAPAGTTVTFSFRARLEGIYEIEFEQAGEPIARLGVSP